MKQEQIVTCTKLSLSDLICFLLLENNNKGVTKQYIEKFTQLADKKLAEQYLLFYVGANEAKIEEAVSVFPFDEYKGKIKIVPEIYNSKSEMNNLKKQQIQKIPAVAYQVLKQVNDNMEENIQEN